MNKGGTGIGSASMALMFAVLCLVVFALISYSAAGNDRVLADTEAELVKGYYEADALAEQITAELLAARTIPESLCGVEIFAGWDDTMAAGTAEFSCPVSGRKELYVKIAVREDSYDILSWRMQDAGEWRADENLPVWPGN